MLIKARTVSRLSHRGLIVWKKNYNTAVLHFFPINQLSSRTLETAFVITGALYFTLSPMSDVPGVSIHVLMDSE